MGSFKLQLLSLLFFALVSPVISDGEADNPPPPGEFFPLPPNFIDPLVDLDHVPVHKQKVLIFLLGNLKSAGNPADCDNHNALKALQTAASEKLKNPGKVARLVRAVTEKLNASCDEISKLATAISDSPDDHADKLRRAAEDSAVVAGQGQQQQQRPPFLPPFFGFPGGAPGGAGSPPSGLPFRFGGTGQNPFFTVPMTAPALEMDLDRLLFICTPVLGINRAFELVKTLHLIHAPRSEVFALQEKFQKEISEEEANNVVKEYEQKLSSSNSAASPSDILHNTAHLSGLNSTEAQRFARSITNTLGPLNSTQALQIHEAIRDSGLNKSELVGITNEIEKLHQGETVTPDGATGHDWIFSGNKRSLVGQVPTRMFSSSRACGFVVQTRVGTIFPWMATLSCANLLCSGTLISSTTVLVAADCVLACGNEPLKVLLGDARIVQPLEIFAQSAVVHPQYTPDNPSHNMALITLSSPVDFNENPMINPICLLYTETDDPDIQCEVVMCNGAGHIPSEQPISKSPVMCYQPNNQICSSNGLFKSTACVSLQTCIPIQTQKSSPVICNRRSRPSRYYLWAVTIPEHSPAKCFNGVARISDCGAFIQGGISV